MPERPLTDAEVRLVVMRWADRERRIARASLRRHVNAVRRELGMPSVEHEAIRAAGAAVSAAVGRIHHTFGTFRAAWAAGYAVAEQRHFTTADDA
ncbi:hypothetical protein GCM10023226_16810 [Nocardioides nanhaiensis]|uniref:Uncharacterized protein n=2 Tax=Nocardioides nanhaiensis TaxID=1476871 RepID=A0ABP8W6F0_9ACTN